MALILVVDDDPKTLELYREVLGGAGHQVVVAENGALGLVRSERRPALILVDLMMPNVNGYEFVRRVREADGHATTPVVVVSGLDTGEWSLRVGADRFLKKPFRNSELLALVDQLLVGGGGGAHRP